MYFTKDIAHCFPEIVFSSSVYIAALIRPYVPVVFFGAFILGTGGGGELLQCAFYKLNHVQRIVVTCYMHISYMQHASLGECCIPHFTFSFVDSTREYSDSELQ